MSWRTASLIFGFVLGIVVTSVIAIVAFPETRAPIIAGLALTVTVLKVCYDVWDKERDRRKKSEESKERVKARVIRIWPGQSRAVSAEGKDLSVLGVELYNDGNLPVNIRRVAFVLIESGGQKKEIEMVANDRNVPLGIGKYHFLVSSREYDRQVMLAAKEHVEFHLVDRTEYKTAWLLAQPADAIWVEFESFGGGVIRIEGETIQAALKA